MASLNEAAAPRVTFDFEPSVVPGIVEGTSSSGWGSRATIVAPSAGDGERFRWSMRQGGWEWDGAAPTLEQAQADAASEANRMLSMQEVDGFDWDADDADEDEGGW